MRTGTANAPLHGGHCPPWLFEKMKLLGATMLEAIVIEYGTPEVLRRLSDPVWFQSLGSVLGFDWHSSGLTTVLCGALKEGMSDRQGDLGLFFAGGKGRASRKTPEEIVQAGETYGLSNDYAGLPQVSRMVAKVDSAAVQDGYQLYHHVFIFDRDGNWAVIQQGMNEAVRYARRYHWLSETVQSYVNDPHRGICGMPAEGVLNLVAGDNEATRLASVELSQERPEQVVKVLEAIAREGRLTNGRQGQPQSMARSQQLTQPQQLTLFDDVFGASTVGPSFGVGTIGSVGDFAGGHTVGRDSSGQTAVGAPSTAVTMPGAHPIPSPRYLNKVLHQLYERPPTSYEGLLEAPGVGPSTLRALAMVAEVTHGTRPSFGDPVRYAFAHGGKDNYPFPVQRSDMEHSLQVMRTAVEKAKMGDRDKLDALRRLALREKEMG
jgi:hypothetical protein